MSRTEWESGEIKIPSKAWKSVREAILNSWNEWHQAMFDKATDYHARLTASMKGQGKSCDILRMLSNLQSGRGTSSEEQWHIESLLIAYPQSFNRGTPKLQKPKKKDAKIYPISKGARLTCGEEMITLDNSTKTVTYSSGENNHACDHARQMPYVIAMFAALKRVEWTRGSGGTICGNDENNQDSNGGYEGGGSNYAKEKYGAKRKGEQTYQW